MESCLERKISDAELEELKINAIDWALAHGIGMRPSVDDSDQDKLVHAPFTLFPTPVPQYIIQQATQSMAYFNRLMHRVAMDHQFLVESFKSVIQTDDFTRNLWNIYMKVHDDEKAQKLCLGLFRNDFMLDKVKESNDGRKFEIKQIEFNSIASSFGGLTAELIPLHRYVLDLVGQNYTDKQVPDNRPIEGLAGGLVRAWELYDNKHAVVLFVVGVNEMNIMDQRFLDYEIYKQNKQIKVIRKTFNDLLKYGKLNEDRKYIISEDEVGVVYYRAGYSPTSYNEKIWQVRLELEQGSCIKCPPINYQLVGAKKIQQILAEPGVLDRFIKDPVVFDMIKSTFAGQYSLDIGKEGDKNLKMAVKSPNNYVLKPQREGGGHNMYDDELVEFLKQHENSAERAGYILMEKIRPQTQTNYLIKAGTPLVKSKCISELGIYGCYIGNEKEELYNTVCGHLLRTKTADTNEGGVCAGFSGIDSPFIIQ
ncbi:hypothetical protein LOTGIDRAFT_213923 [Lottia gigantea]|uniref:Glutathione synthetase n=1 Tax=Lottia gigantea TaxID=225164 RepID=V4A361_LOTGI|nr:hypothetical protein LOTGIDRAFT_213923 [Lottia gigantea]ESO98303.1 hypothetical protein LOTGIDRAFT_213923 [Lottia gigantea]